MNEKKVTLTAEELMLVGKERYYTTISSKWKWFTAIIGAVFIVTLYVTLIMFVIKDDVPSVNKYKDSSGVIIEIYNTDNGVILDGKLYESLPDEQPNTSVWFAVDAAVLLVSATVFIGIDLVLIFYRKRFARKLCAEAGMFVTVVKNDTK